MKTRDRILLASLRLFNEQSERSITTNHIAAALGMSPGNLYYHFRNKEAIIYDLFLQYEQRTRDFLQVDEDVTLGWDDILAYFRSIAGNIWEFRFLHRDMEQLLSNDASLLQRYRTFAQDVIRSGRKIMALMRQQGLIEASDSELDALIINIWVITTSWAPFLHSTALFGDLDTDLSQEMIQRGIHQVMYLLKPYLRGEAGLALQSLPPLYN